MWESILIFNLYFLAISNEFINLNKKSQYSHIKYLLQITYWKYDKEKPNISLKMSNSVNGFKKMCYLKKDTCTYLYPITQ